MPHSLPTVRVGQKLDKYRIEKRLGEGGFATVYQAYDSIEGVRVALKIPHAYGMSSEVLHDFRREIRLNAKLDHPNILPMKSASVIGKYLVIAYPLGEKTLADRIAHRLSARIATELAEQMLEALAYAHHKRIIHCDVKPENFILFAGGRLRLVDFGISKFAHKTIQASGSGTLGYIAPEQAMGKPSFRSDVFSIGLVLYRIYSGCLPEWPFEHPLPRADKIKKRFDPALFAFLQRAIAVKPSKRFCDAGQMRDAFLRIKAKILRPRPRRKRSATVPTNGVHWKQWRQRQFSSLYRTALEARHHCKKCNGPVAESMTYCPWCSLPHTVSRDETRFPLYCHHCKRGMKLDWHYCPWCYSPGVEPTSTRSYSDKRYSARCANPKCQDKRLMSFMRYCPWCHHKVRRSWKIPNTSTTCLGCGWGTLPDFWDYCPWCRTAQRRR